jgi:uncharacterized protein
MGKKEVIDKTKKYVRDRLGNEASGHDWWHAFRVWQTARYIAKKEGGDLFTPHHRNILTIKPGRNGKLMRNKNHQMSKKSVRDAGFTIELAALLHDIADWKFNKGRTNAGTPLIKNFLKRLQVKNEIIQEVCEITENISFKGAKVKTQIRTKEGMIVQDADRLDALGAMGIARAFSYGGHMGREIYNPKIKFRLYKNFKQYQGGGQTTINHFFEKLLLLKNLMNTKTGKDLARERHNFLKKYLKQFFKEWDLK